MVKVRLVRLVRSSYLAYFCLEYLQPVKVILSGGQILKSLLSFSWREQLHVHLILASECCRISDR